MSLHHYQAINTHLKMYVKLFLRFFYVFTYHFFANDSIDRCAEAKDAYETKKCFRLFNTIQQIYIYRIDTDSETCDKSNG